MKATKQMIYWFSLNITHQKLSLIHANSMCTHQAEFRELFTNRLTETCQFNM